MSGSIPVHTLPCILRGFRYLKVYLPLCVCLLVQQVLHDNRVGFLGLSTIDILGQTILCCVGCLAASLVTNH